jgi:hypothetical protein
MAARPLEHVLHTTLPQFLQWCLLVNAVNRWAHLLHAGTSESDSQ